MDTNGQRQFKINLKMIGGLFLVVLLFFIFFSKTIYTYNLPIVTAVSPFNGKLNKLETTTGIVDWEDTEEVYAEKGGKIEEILISERETVKAGQPLFRLVFDTDELHKKLKELEINKSKLSVELENVQIKMNKIAHNVDYLKGETYDKDTLSDYELSQLETKIAKEEEDYEKLKILHQAGGIPKQELEKAEYELQTLHSEYENLQATRSEKEKKEEENIAEKEKNREKQLKDYQYEIEALQQDLKTKNLDLNNLVLQEEAYKKTLQDYIDAKVIYAPNDATVISIPVNQGQRVNENQLMVSFGSDSGYKIECEISRDNNFVTVGDTCIMTNSDNTLEGLVTKITPDERGKKTTISIQSDEVSIGETFELRFEKESAQSYTLIPNGAVNQDSDGYFLYQLKRRKGVLGNEFYAEKLRVYIGDSDRENTALIKGVKFFEPVVLLSDKPFSENDALKIKNEGDFFAD